MSAIYGMPEAPMCCPVITFDGENSQFSCIPVACDGSAFTSITVTPKGTAAVKGSDDAVEKLLESVKKSVGIIPTYQLSAIKEVIFNEEGKTTILIWADGEKTVVRCGEGETFDRYTGFMAAICKRMFGGTTTAKKLMNSLDKKYQAKLKAEADAKEKAKRDAEANEAKKKAEKLRAKKDAEIMEEMVAYFLMENEAKKRADDIIAARDSSSLKVPFYEVEEHEQ